MKSINKNQTQLRTLLFGLLCVLAGVMCFAQGFSHGSVSPAVSKSNGERLGDSPPSTVLRDAGTVQFTSFTPRYITKRIADIEVGEEVVAKDPDTGDVTTKTVANVFRKISDHLRILQVRNPHTNELQTIETTDDHPFWVAARGDWIDAKDLKPDDRLDEVDGGTAILESTSRELHPEGIPVFNFEVEDFHTYFVRRHDSRGPPVLTHNTECGDITIVFGLSDELKVLKNRYKGSIDYERFHDRGLSIDDLRNPENESVFMQGVRSAISDQRVKEIVFGLEGVNFKRLSAELDRAPRLTDYYRSISGNITAHELKELHQRLGLLNQRGASVRFSLGGKEYDDLGDALRSRISDEQVAEILQKLKPGYSPN